MIDRNIIPDDLIMMPNIKSEDTATWWNILRAGYTAYGLNENLVRYRRVKGTLSSNKLEAQRRIWRLLRDIAGLNVIQSAWHFCLWAVLAVYRRL
jgi:teichuronic acid biosynthesis glycosyltransferase TuaG